MSLIEVAGVTKRFGGLTALRGVSLKVEPGEILGIVGPNGAGKTTLFSVISGSLRPNEGKVLFQGRDITGAAPHDICSHGLVRTFQIMRPFHDMTVLGNATVAASLRCRSLHEARRKAEAVLGSLGMSGQASTLASVLPLPSLKKLELARALATEPTVLLMDELFAGLDRHEVEELAATVHRIVERGVTVIIIEHVLPALRLLARRVLAMNFGEILTEGTFDQVMAHPKVVEAYLGLRASAQWSRQLASQKKEDSQ